MNVGYVEQTAYDLSYYLEEGENIQDLTILQEQTLIIPNAKIRSAIIGESHFVVFRAFDTILTEILACINRNATKKNFCCSKLSNNFSTFRHELPNAYYHFQIHVFDIWQKGMNSLRGIEILAENHAKNRIGLIQNFPQAANHRKPCTILVVEADNRSVRVNSMHTYPTDNNGRGRIVQTMSCLEKL